MKKILLYLTCLLLFLLPWQTRLIYHTATLNGGFWEYGSESVYGTELLLDGIIVLLLISFARNAELRKQIFTREYFQSKKKLLYYYIGILLFFGLHSAFSTNPRLSWNWTLHLIEAACIALILVLFHTSTIKLITSLWLGGVVQGLLALYQFLVQEITANKWFGMAYHAGKELGDYVIEFGSGEEAERWLRAYGSFGSPNILGGFLAITWLVGIILYIELHRVEKYKAALLVSVGNVLVTVGLVLSFSRSAWLAAAAGAVIMVVGTLRTMSLRHVVKQLFFSCIVVILLFAIYQPLFLARATAEGRLENKSLIERQTQYSEAMKIINKHALWGVGPGTYTQELYASNPKRMVWEYQPVHNVFALAWAEMGVTGEIILLLLYYYIIKLLWRRNKIFLAVLIPIVITSFVDHYWWSLYSGMIVWGAAIGLCLAHALKQKNQPA